MCICIYVYMCIYIYMYICIYMHIYLNIHIRLSQLLVMTLLTSLPRGQFNCLLRQFSLGLDLIYSVVNDREAIR